MKLLTSWCLLALGSCFAFAAAAAECEHPATISIPDGKTSTYDQLLEAQRNVKTYVAKMEEYVACMDAEIEGAGEDVPPESKALMITERNNGVDEMRSIAAAFNVQVQAYKAANPAPAAN